MKKIFFLVIISFILSSCTDNSAVNMAFVKYGYKKGVTSITVPGFVVRLAARFADLEKEEREFLMSIDKVKVLTVEGHKLNERIDFHDEFYTNMNKHGEYEELINVSDEHESVTVFGKMVDDDVIKEMIVLVGGNDNTLVYLKGHFSAKMVEKHINLNDTGNLLSFDF